jgi:hypothetical protein
MGTSKKYRINTTISRKHRELLNKHTATFETQQKVLEAALECLDSCTKHRAALTPEQDLMVRCLEGNSACLIQKDSLKLLMKTADLESFREYVIQYKPIEYGVEFFHHKPLKDCSLKEVMEGIVINARMSNWFDSADYTDDGDSYMLKITHTLGKNASEQLKIVIESVFTSYGVPARSTISGKTFFMKVGKEQVL